MSKDEDNEEMDLTDDDLSILEGIWDEMPEEDAGSKEEEEPKGNDPV